MPLASYSLPFGVAERLHSLAATLALPRVAIGAACLAWVAARHAELDDEASMRVTIEDGDWRATAELYPTADVTLACLAAEAAALTLTVHDGDVDAAAQSAMFALFVSTRPRPVHTAATEGVVVVVLSVPARGGLAVHSSDDRIAEQVR